MHYPFIEKYFDYDEAAKEAYISEKIKYICSSILRNGDKTGYKRVFDSLYEYIEQNIEDFLTERTSE